MKILVLIPLLFTFVAHSAESHNSIEVAKELTTIIDAQPIERFPPKYPISAARKGMDGWVQLSFIVEPDGSVSNPVVENSSGYKGFEKEALKAIKKWKYQPAMENGETVQQCQNSVQLDFMLARDKDVVSKKFYRLYSSFDQALTEKDDKLISELASEVESYQIKTIEESYHLYTLLARYAQFINDAELAINYLDKAIKFSGSSEYFNYKRNQEAVSAVGVKVKAGQDTEQALSDAKKKRFENKDKKLYPLLHEKLVLELDAGRVAAAYKTVSELLLLESAKANYPAYSKQKKVLDELINSEQSILTSANIKNRDFWHYKLLRNQFQFSNIDGRLTKLDVRCRNKRHVYTINDTSKWTLPDSWQGCSIYVYGENDTKFSLVETGVKGNLVGN